MKHSHVSKMAQATLLPRLIAKYRPVLSEQNLVHSLMVLPALAFYIPLFVVPIVLGLAVSFGDWSGVAGALDMEWIGAENYVELAGDRKFWASLGITLRYAAMVVPSQLLISLFLAAAVNSGRGMLAAGVKVAILTPIAMSAVAIGILATFLFSPQIGIPALLSNEPIDLFAEPNGALLGVSIAHVWGGIGFTTFIFLAGLQAIPEELYEAAKIDGAGLLARFWRVTIPLLRETTIVNLILIFIGAFRSFGLIYTMTRGGPYRATEVLSFFMYKQAFVAFRMSYGSAIAVILFLIIAAITLFKLRVTRAGTTKYY